LEVVAVFGEMPVITMNFFRAARGRLALAAMKSDHLEPCRAATWLR
jgi:hypothetical protein